MELTLPHKYIKNSSTCGKFPQNTLLNAGKDTRCPEVQERSSFNGRVKEKRRELGPDLHTGKGAVKDERFPHSGKTLHQWEDQPGQKGSLEAQRVQQPAVSRQYRETGRENPCYLAAIPSPRCVPASIYVGRVLKWQFPKTDPGDDWGW